MSKQIEEPRASKQILVRMLQLGGIAGFAIAQPMFALMGRYPEFLVTHKMAGLGIVLMTLAIILLPMIALSIFELLFLPFGRRTVERVHLVLLTILAALVFQVPLNKIRSLPGYSAVALAIVLAIIFAVLYASKKTVRSYVTITALALLIFPCYFVFLTPVSKLLFSGDGNRGFKVKFADKPPIVLVVCDEFAIRDLLDSNREIDPERFPHFAALAREANWYRHATTVSDDTVYAVPAILTGCRPQHRALPILDEYPNNLFTFLQSGYKMKVQEVVTHLCPTGATGFDNAAANAPSLVADLGVLYAYLVVPPAGWEKLPSIMHGWGGFADNLIPKNWMPQSEDTTEALGYDERLIQAETFLNNIMPNEAQTLHFMHILLPHTPYDFLATGQFYGPVGSEPRGLQKDKTWVKGGLLAETAEQRFINQIGVVDRFIGQLTERLKQTGLYDKALVIVTADHGVGFAPEYHYRQASPENPGYTDILTLPLFVKFPGQKQGKIVDGFASTVDVMPTIAQVLGCDVPWPHDGHSLVQEPAGGPHKIVFPDLYNLRGGKAFEFDWEEVCKLPNLKSQIERFGERTSLDNLRMHGPFAELLGRRVSELSCVTDNKLKIQYDQATLLSTPVDFKRRFIPLYQSGRIMGQAGASPLHVAVAANGVISAVAETFNQDANAEFRALIPRNALVEGVNDVRFYVIDKAADNRVQLVSSNVVAPFTLTRLADGKRAIEIADGSVVPIVQGAIRGVLQPLETAADTMLFSGWGVDEKAKKPAQAALVFSNGQFVTKLSLNIDRPDLVKNMDPACLKCGFYRLLPLDFFHNAEISVFFLGDDKASEAQYMRTDIFGPRLGNERLLSLDKLRISIGAQGGAVIMRPDGALLGPTTSTLIGAVESVSTSGTTLAIKGWAASPMQKSPVTGILVFYGDTLIGGNPPNTARPTLAGRLGTDSQMKIGFNMTLPVDRFVPLDASKLSVYAWNHRIGVNRLAVGNAAINLRNMKIRAPYRIETAADGSQSLVMTSMGKSLPISRGALRGVLQPIMNDPEGLTLSGWVIDEKERTPAEQVLVFADDQFVGSIRIGEDRPDIAKWLGQEYVRSGFRATWAASMIRQSLVRVYAITSSKACELKYLHQAANGGAELSDNPVLVADGLKLGAGAAGGRTILGPGGHALDLTTTTLLRGALEKLETNRSSVRVCGWAAAPTTSPIKAILVFADDRLVGYGQTNLSRPGINRSFKIPENRPVGFDFTVPVAPTSHTREMLVFAWSIGGEVLNLGVPGKQVSELTINPAASIQQRRIQDFTVRRDGGLTIEIDPGIAWLTGYRKNAEFFPGHLTGRVIRPGATGPMRVAVAMNGTLLDLVQMSDARPGDWSYDVPPNVLGPDANRIGLYVVDQTSGGLVLSEGKLVSRPRMVRDPGGQTWLMDGNGGRLPVEDGALRGAVQPLGTDRDYLIVSGWAIDEARKTPVTKVAIFSGEDFVADLDVKVERKDLTGWLGESYLKCGFYRYLPLYLFKNRQVRAFAISGDTASELKYLYANPNGKTQLDAIPFFRFDRLRLDRDRIVNDAGKPFGIPGDEIKGRLLSSNVAGNGVEVAGWACDDKTRAPADAILVFLNGSYVGYGPVNQPTPDKAETPANVSRPLGFRLKLPSSGLGNVAVFAYMADGRLARLR